MQMIRNEIDRTRAETGGLVSMLLAAAVIFAGLMACGCMQLTGIKKMDAWGLVVESNSGFEVLAGAKQYEYIDDRKGMNMDKNGAAGVQGGKK